MPLVLGGSSAPAAAFSVDNSCIFDAASDSKLSKAVSSGAGNTKWCFSTWFKPSNYNAYQRFFWGGVISGAETGITLYGSARGDAYDSIIAIVFTADASTTSRSWTTASFYQDCTAWTHLLVRYDSTDVTADDRIQIWVNGTRISDWSSQGGGNPDLNETCDVFAANNLAVGREVDSGDNWSYNGYLAEVCVLDGTAADATDFGEFDETNATVWKPKKVSGLAFGTNGFYLDFKDSANLGNDANGGTDLTESNIDAADQATDTPTNNFCTWNDLNEYDGTFSQGNLIATGTGSYNAFGTFGMMKGKWYWENHLSRSHIMLGMAECNISDQGSPQSIWPYYMIYDNGGATYTYNNATSVVSAAITSLGNFADGVIVGIAFDADAQKMWASFNGTWYDVGSGTGDPAAGTNEMFGSVIPRYFGTIVPATGAGTASSEIIISVNFGNPSFTISSGNADGNGYGNFEYAPPTGFLALCTKNLGSDGG